MNTRITTVIAQTFQERRMTPFTALRTGLLTLLVALAPALSWAEGQSKESKQVKASAVIRIACQTSDALGQKAWSEGDYQNYQRTQAVLVKSRPVVASALRNPKIASLAIVKEQKEPMEWLARSLQTDFDMGPELLRLSLRSQNGQDAVAVLDAVLEAFVTEIIDKEKDQQGRRLGLVTALKAFYEKSLQDARAELQKRKNLMGNDTILDPVLRQEMLDFAKKRAQVRIEAIELEAQNEADNEAAFRPQSSRRLKSLQKQELLLTEEIEMRAQRLRNPEEATSAYKLVQQKISQCETLLKTLGPEIKRLSSSLKTAPRVQVLRRAFLNTEP